MFVICADTNQKGVLLTIQPTLQRVKQARIGAVCFNNGRMAFVAGYNTCLHCGVNGKVLITKEDAEKLGRNFFYRRAPLGAKIIKQLANWYGI